MRVGLDDDTDPDNVPPANLDDPDGVAGSGDELVLGILQVTLQHGTSGTPCQTAFEFVPEGRSEVTFDNFDMDGSGSVCYHAPSHTYDSSGIGYGVAVASATIGEAFRDAKREMALTQPERLDVLLGHTLLGDPAIVLSPEDRR